MVSASISTQLTCIVSRARSASGLCRGISRRELTFRSRALRQNRRSVDAAASQASGMAAQAGRPAGITDNVWQQSDLVREHWARGVSVLQETTKIPSINELHRFTPQLVLRKPEVAWHVHMPWHIA